MKDFFKNEWNLFKADMQDLGEMVISVFEKEERLMLNASNKVVEKKEGFFKKEWKLFLNDMQDLGEMILAAFGADEQLLLNPPEETKIETAKAEPGFIKREWALFKTDISNLNKGIEGIFGFKKQNPSVEMFTEPVYIKDEVDYKLETYLLEPVEELRENISGEKTQHEVLRDYAMYFKPYAENSEMCQSAFKKYYDRHALKMAINEFPVEQARIIQNNVDLFIKGQEVFGDGGQFIDSRVDTIFEKVGMNEVNKMVTILSDTISDGKNLQGERVFAEAVSYMVDNGIKVEKAGKLIAPVKKALEEKLDKVHNSLKAHSDWNDEYQALLSQERKYLYALNRIEQYETEQRIAEFESKLNDLDVIV